MASAIASAPPISRASNPARRADRFRHLRRPVGVRRRAAGGLCQQGGAGDGRRLSLPSIAAVVLGGTSILGGRGSYIGTVAGVILITLLQSILSVDADRGGGPPDDLRRCHHRHAAALRTRAGGAVTATEGARGPRARTQASTLPERSRRRHWGTRGAQLGVVDVDETEWLHFAAASEVPYRQNYRHVRH